jgi:ADP-heptose:LPS heptosyltransferase
MFEINKGTGPGKYAYAVLKSKLVRRLFNPRFGKVERVSEGSICIVMSEANRLGDLIIHNFLVQQLQQWGYSVVLGMSASFYRRHKDFFTNHCLTKRILVCNGNKRGWFSFNSKARKEKIAGVILDAQPMISPLFFYLAGIPSIQGLRGSNVSFCSKEYYLDKPNIHYTRLVSSLLQLLDSAVKRENRHTVMPFLPYSPVNVEKLKGIKSCLLAVHIGGSNHWNRKWPLEKYLLLGQMYLENYPGALVLVGGEEEKQSCEMVKNILEVNCSAEGRIINCCSSDLNTTASVLAQCDVFVGNDSGPMHIANALNKRVIVICGPSAIHAVNPSGYDKRNFTVHLDLECIPCLDRQCRLPADRQFSCLNDLDVGMIWEKLQSVMRVSYKALTK